jgi:hypothetical protein
MTPKKAKCGQAKEGWQACPKTQKARLFGRAFESYLTPIFRVAN